jgi:hypothetical protein
MSKRPATDQHGLLCTFPTGGSCTCAAPQVMTTRTRHNQRLRPPTAP